jgi:hypothetical protein
MKIRNLLFGILLIASTTAFAQKTPVMIIMKDGSTHEGVHFGQLKCGKDSYRDNFIMLKGVYNGNTQEIKEYSKISKLVLEGFTQPPVASIGNQKGTVRVFKKDGISVTLTDAELIMSCYASGDLYNQIVIQSINPLTDKVEEVALDVKDIQSINFR